MVHTSGCVDWGLLLQHTLTVCSPRPVLVRALVQVHPLHACRAVED